MHSTITFSIFKIKKKKLYEIKLLVQASKW